MIYTVICACRLLVTHTIVLPLQVPPTLKSLLTASLHCGDMCLTELPQLYSAAAGGLASFSFKNTSHLISTSPRTSDDAWRTLWKASQLVCSALQRETSARGMMAPNFLVLECWNGFGRESELEKVMECIAPKSSCSFYFCWAVYKAVSENVWSVSYGANAGQCPALPGTFWVILCCIACY